MSTYQLNYTGEQISNILSKADSISIDDGNYSIKEVTLDSAVAEYAETGLNASEIILYLEGAPASEGAANLYLHINTVHVLSVWYEQTSNYCKIEARIIRSGNQTFISSTGAAGQYEQSLSPIYTSFFKDTNETKIDNFVISMANNTINLPANFKIKILYK